MRLAKVIGAVTITADELAISRVFIPIPRAAA
jgi:hypothetical protein